MYIKGVFLTLILTFLNNLKEILMCNLWGNNNMYRWKMFGELYSLYSNVVQ